MAAAPALAHHSFAAEYDRTKPIKFTGKVTKVEWMNPHIYFYVDVKDEATGKVINYACEGGAPNGLYRNGWRKDSFESRRHRFRGRLAGKRRIQYRQRQQRDSSGWQESLRGLLG
jgi:hypothetical protein